MGSIFSGHEAPGPAPSGRAVFIGKDGTLVEHVPHNVDPAKVRFTPHAMEGLRLLAEHGYRLIVVTNQPGLAYGMFTRAALTQLQLALAGMMEREGVHLAGFYACPHAPGPAGPVPACLCRKPAPGLLRQAARAHGLDLARCWMIGDVLDAVEAGRRAGCRSAMLDVGHETAWRMSPLRTPHVRAKDLLEAAHAILAADAAGATDAAAGRAAAPDEGQAAPRAPDALPDRPSDAREPGVPRRMLAAAWAVSAPLRTSGARP